MRTIVGGVRRLGVRGLGLKQKEKRRVTEAKIVSFLSVSPFTYEQLRNISKIHRNILKLRLDQLSNNGIIMKHRYSIPFKFEYYGYMYRYPIKYRPPLFNHIYYLLNLSKTIKIQELISPFLVRTEDEFEVDRLTGKIEIQNLPSFCLVPSVLKSLVPSVLEQSRRLVGEGNFNKRYFSPSELIEDHRKLVEIILYTSRWFRECDLSAVKNRAYVPGAPLREKDSKTLKKTIDFFIKRGYSLQDILIRCSAEHTLINGERFYLDGSMDTLSLPMTNYSVLWYAVEKRGYFKEQIN